MQQLSIPFTLGRSFVPLDPPSFHLMISRHIQLIDIDLIVHELILYLRSSMFLFLRY